MTIEKSFKTVSSALFSNVHNPSWEQWPATSIPRTHSFFWRFLLLLSFIGCISYQYWQNLSCYKHFGVQSTLKYRSKTVRCYDTQPRTNSARARLCVRNKFYPLPPCCPAYIVVLYQVSFPIPPPPPPCIWKAFPVMHLRAVTLTYLTSLLLECGQLFLDNVSSQEKWIWIKSCCLLFSQIHGDEDNKIIFTRGQKRIAYILIPLCAIRPLTGHMGFNYSVICGLYYQPQIFPLSQCLERCGSM